MMEGSGRPGQSQYQPEISTLPGHRYCSVEHILHLLTTGQFSDENWFSKRPAPGGGGRDAVAAAGFYSFMFLTACLLFFNQ